MTDKTWKTSDVIRAAHDYSMCVSQDIWLGRVQAHSRLKNALWYATNIDCWDQFRPFESEDIVDIPSFDDCLMIIWRAVEKQLRERVDERGHTGHEPERDQESDWSAKELQRVVDDLDD
jgi:hypothetical protein